MKFRYCLLAALALAGCSKVEKPETSPSFTGARIVSSYLAILEKPTATRCLIAGSRAGDYREFFERAGLKVDNLDEKNGKYDMVFIAGDTKGPIGILVDKCLAAKGVLARVVDARGKRVNELETEFAQFKALLPSAHLWMPGIEDWLLVGRSESAKIKLSAMMEVFAREDSFDDLDAAGCSSLPELFASYVGTLDEVLPAFAGLDGAALARPQFFVAKAIPAIDWIDVDEAVDADVMAAVAAESRAMQEARRTVLEGGILADAHQIDEATEAWARAAAANPHDPMLIDRLERLWKNADTFFRVGNFALAAKCYETYLMIRPDDWQSAEALAFCLNQLGQRDLAAQIHDKAMRLKDGNQAR